jgi:hypothetical protein
MMDRHAEAFLEMLAAERGAARNTIAPIRTTSPISAPGARRAASRR